MLRPQKESHPRELEEEQGDFAGALRVDENEVEDDDKGRASMWADRRASFEDDDDDEPEMEDLDLDDLYAMEGPDAA